MKKFCFCTLSLLALTNIWGSSLQNLPKMFFVEDQNGHSTLYDIKTDQKMLGIASQELFRLSSSFQLKNTSEELLATAQSHFYCWGIIANIWNSYNEKMGWIEEQSFQWFSRPICRIYDQNNSLIGVAQRNFWGNQLQILNPDNLSHVYAIIHRPWHRFSNDLWQVQICDETPFQNRTIDASILVLLATYDSNHNQESKVIEYSQDDEYVFMNKDGFIQLGLEVESKPQVSFSQEVNEEQQAKIEQLFSDLSSHSSEFPNRFSCNEEVLKDDERQAQLLLEDLIISESDLVLNYESLPNKEIPYTELVKSRIQSEVNRWIRTLEIGLALLNDPYVGYKQRESLYHMLNEFVSEIVK